MFFSDRERNRGFFFIPDWIGIGPLGCYDDSFVYGDSDDPDAPGCYDEQSAEPDQPTIYGGDDEEPAGETPAYQPPVYEPPAGTQRPAELPANEIATTIVFKDGRPSEQVHNYALTRTTLFVLDDQQRRDIPLDDVDMTATEKVNRAAGIRFQIPQIPE